MGKRRFDARAVAERLASGDLSVVEIKEVRTRDGDGNKYDRDHNERDDGLPAKLSPSDADHDAASIDVAL